MHVQHYPLLDLSDCHFSILFLLSEMFDNGILVKYAYSCLKIITMSNLGFITAHSSLITAQMGSVTPLF